MSNVTFHNTQWLFLDKFCFDKNAAGDNDAALFIKFAAPHDSRTVLAAYHDVSKTDFDEIAASGVSCDYKLHLANSIMVPTRSRDGNDSIFETNFKVYGRSPHWWYIVAADCSTSQNLDSQNIEISSLVLNFTNHGKQTGVDDYGIFETLCAVTAIQLILLVLSLVYLVAFCKMDTYKETRQCLLLLLMSLLSEGVSNWSNLVFYFFYSKFGYGEEVNLDIAGFTKLAAQSFFVSLFLCLSSGWLDAKMVSTKKRDLIQLLLVYTVALLFLFDKSLDTTLPSDTRSLYQTPAGLVIVALRCLLLLVFLQRVYTSYYLETTILKKQFYQHLCFLGVLYFSSLPACVLTASFANDWNRKKSVVIFEALINTICYIDLVYLLRPKSQYLFQVYDPVLEEKYKSRNGAAVRVPVEQLVAKQCTNVKSLEMQFTNPQTVL